MPFKPHHRVTRDAAAQLNQMEQTVQSLTHVGEGSFGVDGVQPDLPQIYPIVRITGIEVASGDYLFAYRCQVVQWVSVADDHLKPLVGDVPGFTVEVAYEYSNNGHVPVDGSVIVPLQPQPDGKWVFQWQDELVKAVLGTEGTGGKYAWVEVRQDTAGGGFTTFSAGRFGSETLNFAQEINQGTGLTGRYVYLQRGFCSGAPQVLVDVASPAGVSSWQVQSVRIVRAASGTFTLSFFDGTTQETTAAIDFDANAAALEAALEALTNITDVSVTGTGTDADPFLVEFLDSFTEYPLMIPNGDALGSDQEWNFDGSVGPAGPIGPAGPSSMIPGKQGKPGQDAEDGRPGPRGAKGTRGLRGFTGPRGKGMRGEDGEEGERGRPGTRGNSGPRGIFGGALAFDMIFDGVNFGNSDPGPGKVRLSSSPQTSSAQMYVDILDAYAISITQALFLVTSGYVRLVAKNDAARYLIWRLDSASLPGGYYVWNLTILVPSSSASPLIDGERVILEAIPAGGAVSPLTTPGDIWAHNGADARFPAAASSGWSLISDLSLPFKMKWALVTGAGTVTSVGLALPTSVFTITVSPITGAGTLTAVFKTQNANTFFRGPVGGGPSVPAFGIIVNADLTDGIITYAKIQNVSATKLLGRGSASGAGAVQEITVGTGLSLVGTTLTATGGAASAPGKDFNWYKHVGSNRYYAGGQVTPSRIGDTGTPVTCEGYLAVPFYAPRGGTLDRIGAEIVPNFSTAGTAIRFGIYTSISDTVLYPGSKVVDAGTVDGHVDGPAFLTISYALTAGTLYWLVCTGATNGVLAGFIRPFADVEASWPIFGYDETLVDTGQWLYAPIASPGGDGTLPATFPIGASIMGDLAPAIVVRFSA